MQGRRFTPRHFGVGTSEEGLPLVLRAVPAFAHLSFSGCLNPTDSQPSGIIRWDGDPFCVHADSRMFGQNRMMAWGPLPAGADRAEWRRSTNTVAARFMNEAWTREPALRQGLGDLHRSVIYRFADEFLARLPHEWELTGNLVLLWIHTGRVPDFACATAQSRDLAASQKHAAYQALLSSPERQAERLQRMRNVGLIPAGR